MTEIVKKGAGRPAATARSNKHAQRTPLPPKPGSIAEQAVEFGRSVPPHKRNGMVEIEPKGYGQMTVAELRAEAKRLGVGIPGLSRMAKGALLTAILEWERAGVAVADRPVSFPEPAPIDVALDESFPIKEQAEEPSPAEGTLETLSEDGKKSLSKAANFLEESVRLGWSADKQGTQDPAHYGVTVARGAERIEIEWVGGVFQGDTCYYSHPARTPIKLRNASHAKKVMAIPAEKADEEARKVSAHKVTRPARKSQAETISAGRKALPFDVDTATDEEVISAVANRNVAWTNEISGAIEDAYVSSSPTIQQGTSGRSLSFVSVTGFRSVRVSSIVAVR
jgi:hypothetical protein